MKKLDDFYKSKPHYVKVEIDGEDVYMLSTDAQEAKRDYQKYINKMCEATGIDGSGMVWLGGGYYVFSENLNKWVPDDDD